MTNIEWTTALIQRCLVAWEAGTPFADHRDAGWLLRSFEDIKLIEDGSAYEYGEIMYAALSAWKAGEQITEEHKNAMGRIIREFREAGGKV